jgi:hypothetical protein
MISLYVSKGKWAQVATRNGDVNYAVLDQYCKNLLQQNSGNKLNVLQDLEQKKEEVLSQIQKILQGNNWVSNIKQLEKNKSN